MNREELEKMFDEYFWKYAERWKTVPAFDDNNVKQFVFETIIPEVLKNMLREITPTNERYLKDWNKWLKKQAKEQFNIDL